MSDWAKILDSLTGDIRKNVRDTARAVRSVFKDEPYEVLTYRGYGNKHRAFVTGRVLEKRGIDASSDADSNLTNLLNTYRRIDSDPAPFAALAIDYQGVQSTVRADDEGFFCEWIETPEDRTTDEEWVAYDASLLAPRPAGTEVAKTSGEVLIPPASARLCIISDIDDTVIQSRVSNFLRAAKAVMLGNARTRLPFPGVSAFYEALRNGAAGDEKNPIFYVSSGPWNIYDVICEFMDIQKMPKGPLILRDWDIGFSALSSAGHFEHKGAAIGHIMRLYPDLKFILIGDSSQHDPEIYRQTVHDFPRRVAAIYIRDVSHDAERSSAIAMLADEVVVAHSTLVLCENTLDAAKHALERGWIRADALAGIGAEKAADEGRDESKVPAPDGGEPGDGAPPIIVDGTGRSASEP